LVARADAIQLLLGFSQLVNDAHHGLGSQTRNYESSLTRFSLVQNFSGPEFLIKNHHLSCSESDFFCRIKQSKNIKKNGHRKNGHCRVVQSGIGLIP
jgi:hypothetical protein